MPSRSELMQQRRARCSTLLHPHRSCGRGGAALRIRASGRSRSGSHKVFRRLRRLRRLLLLLGRVRSVLHGICAGLRASSLIKEVLYVPMSPAAICSTAHARLQQLQHTRQAARPHRLARPRGPPSTHPLTAASSRPTRPPSSAGASPSAPLHPPCPPPP